MTTAADILLRLGLPPLPSQSTDTMMGLIWARDLLQQHITTTYAVQDPKGIEELKAVNIGGVKQWLHIRGRNKANPVMLYLHGGPGEPMIGYMDAIQRPWEDYFTVVHWDQRQTGKSYYPADDENNPLTIDQFISDTEEMIKYLLDYLRKEKLFILGHSWGSVLGMQMVKHHPEWLYAYIGVGQMVNQMDSEIILCQRIAAYAKQQQKFELAGKMKALIDSFESETAIRDKAFAENCAFIREQLSLLARETAAHHWSRQDLTKIINLDRLLSPHLTAADLCNATFGSPQALIRAPYSNLANEFNDINLPEQLGNVFDVPIFFFSGRHDYQTAVTLSDQWFGEIEAPHKKLIHFEESSHVIVNEEPGRVLIALVTQVLPFALTDTNKTSSHSGGT